MRAGKVEAVTRLKEINSELSLCKITIDFDEYHIFADFGEISQWTGKYVEYSIRGDVYEGQLLTVVNNIVDTITTQVVPEVENIQLFLANDKYKPVCNFKIDDLKFGDKDFECIGFLASYEEGASQRAKWLDMTVIDAASKSFILRFFSTNTVDNIEASDWMAKALGSYIKFDITHTKYGYQTDAIDVLNTPVVVPPEVEIAVRQVKKAVRGDTGLSEYLSKYNYFETLRTKIHYELGYHLVELGMEIYLINTLANISRDFDTQLLYRMAVCSRGYLVGNTSESSVDVLNVNRILTCSLKTDKTLVVALDSASTKDIPERTVFKIIRRFVSNIMDERRGITHEEKSLDFAKSLYTALNGMF